MMDTWKTWKMPLKAALPLFGVGVMTLLLSLCFCCYLWRLKRRTRTEFGYKRVNFKKKKSRIQDTCSVCLEDFREGDPIAQCHCSHAFHHKCLLEWLNMSNTCPLCKARVRKTSEDSETTCLVRNNTQVAYV